MREDTSQIADHLIAQYGVDGALETVRAGIEAAHANRDNYRLSIWRELRRVLKDRQGAAED